MYDRVASPLSGAFVLSWCVWNWRILAYLFLGSATAPERVSWVTTAANNDWKTLLIWPAISALVLTFAYPWPAFVAYTYSVWITEKSLKAKEAHDRKQRLTMEQSQSILAENYQLRTTMRDQEATLGALRKVASEAESGRQAALTSRESVASEFENFKRSTESKRQEFDAAHERGREELGRLVHLTEQVAPPTLRPAPGASADPERDLGPDEIRVPLMTRIRWLADQIEAATRQSDGRRAERFMESARDLLRKAFDPQVSVGFRDAVAGNGGDPVPLPEAGAPNDSGYAARAAAINARYLRRLSHDMPATRKYFTKLPPEADAP